jgi:hypothetical protein
MMSFNFTTIEGQVNRVESVDDYAKISLNSDGCIFVVRVFGTLAASALDRISWNDHVIISGKLVSYDDGVYIYGKEIQFIRRAS